MTKRMLIDATHAEETRVVVLDGNRLEDFDVETAARKQLKGNIYLAKVVRVEPSLQAAFVEYGGGRHGFLAFGEIHPDYYQIPVADRQRLLAMQEAEARAEEEAEDAAAAAAEAAGEIPAEGFDAVTETIAAPIELGAGMMPEDDTEAADTELGAEPPLPAEEAASETTLAAIVTQDMVVARDEVAAHEVAAEHARDAELPEAEFGVDTAPELVDAEAQAAAAAQERAEPFADDVAVAPAATVDAASAVSGSGQSEEPGDGEPVADLVGDETARDEMSGEAPPEENGAGLDLAQHADDVLQPGGLQPGGLQPGGLQPGGLQPGGLQPGGLQPEAHQVGAHQSEEHQVGDHHAEDPNGEEQASPRSPSRFMRSYKIQEVIRRRQILLIQVVKEERGTKGAALTTFISLAGRFSVLMPNSPRGGGISRKITSAADRRRLKEVTAELQIPRGMGLIVRTAGAARPKAEIKRDCEYLLDLWDSIRETTMASVAPTLIHEEANLIRRVIRDNYSRDVDEVMVDGEAGWRAARDFMRMLMPAHARKVVLWQEPQPLFARNGVEAQLDAMLQPTVQLRSGGYLVINQTEALVAIDVNSGRSTRERGIEETALKTNLEAADEVARQLRLRDLAGLVVIDFIDMEQRRNNAAVEKRMKDALRDDRARIQMGGISHFGLMELSRQRLRPSLAETSFTTCPHCGGTGHVRTTEMAALAVLRQVEDEGAKRRSAAIVVHVAGAVALYILNHKRVRLAEIEARHVMSVAFAADDSLLPPEIRIEKLRGYLPGEAPQGAIAAPALAAATPDEDDAVQEADDEVDDDVVVQAEAADDGDAPRPGETAEEAASRGRKRRRRRRGGRRDDGVAAAPPSALADPGSAEQPDLSIPPFPQAADTMPVEFSDVGEPVAQGEDATVEAGVPAGVEVGEPGADAGDEDARGRRRGRRGGRRRRREPRDGEVAAEGGEPASFDAEPEPSPLPERPVYSPPAYTGPTPANPFGGDVFDIFSIMDEPEPEAVPPRPSVPVSAARAPLVEHVSAETPEPAVHAPAAEPDLFAEPVAELVAEPLAEPVAEELPLANGHAEPASEPVSSPVPPPVLIGAGDPAAEKKRGWWRR